METIGVENSSSQISAENVMLQRTKQIVWFVLAALIGNLIIVIYREGPYQAAIVTFLIFCMCFAARFAAKQQYRIAAQIVISVLTFGVLAIIWTSGGLYDLSLLAIPGISIFAAMLGMTRVNSIVLIVCAINIMLIGACEHYGIATFETSAHGFTRAISICLVLMPILLATYLLTGDYRTVLANLKDSLNAIKKHADNANFLANHDVLTQLPNRALVKSRFEHAKTLAERHCQKRIALLYLDIDEFKVINDSWGHQVGDKYIQFIAEACKSSLRESDTLARLGGDEFLVVVEQVNEIDELVVVANNLLNAGRQRYPIEDSNSCVASSVSIGIALYPDDATHYEGLMAKADLAMYHAKKSGRNTFSFFNNTMSENALQRAHLLEDMKEALANKQFFMAYQPIININTGESEGAEALIRWKHPSRGLVSPAEFIPIAEQSGFIVELGEWILEQAIVDCLRFQQAINRPYLMSVNVSAIQLRRGDFTKLLQQLLTKHQLPDNSLCIELTESELFSENKEFVELLEFSRQNTIKIAIDDFGTGYSNLGYLHRLNLSRLKLDYSFITKLDKSEQKQAVVGSIKHLATGLKMETVAEGVETAGELEHILQIGLDRAQGYLWTKPLPFSAAVAFINNQPPSV